MQLDLIVLTKTKRDELLLQIVRIQWQRYSQHTILTI
jgi:hypothetical protein